MEYSIQTIVSAWDSLIGWRVDPTGVVELPGSFHTSSSGRFFQEGHPLMDLRAIKDIAPIFTSVYPTWVVGTAYTTGTRVTYGGVNYRAKLAGTGRQPDTEPTYWEVYDYFAEWLQIKKQEAIATTVASHYWQSVGDRSIRRVLDKTTLFQAASRNRATVSNGPYKVGFEIETTSWKDLLLTIHRVGLHTTGDEALSIEIYHSSKGGVLYTIPVTSEANSFTWTLPESDVVLSDMTLEPGGFFYVVYSQQDLNGEAIIFNRDWNVIPCVSCNPIEHTNYGSIRRTMTIRPFRVPLADTIDNELWDLSKNQYTSTVNYGLNLELSVTCDLATLYVDNKSSFADLLLLNFTCSIIEAMAMNVSRRENRTTFGMGFQELAYILDGDSSGNIQGIRKKADKLIKNINLDLSTVNPTCLKKAKTGGRLRSA